MTIKSSVSLTDEQHAFARSLVATGRYSSVSAVLQQGVDLLRQRMTAEEIDVEALRTLLQRRLDGDFISAAEMDERLERMIDAKRREHDLSS